MKKYANLLISVFAVITGNGLASELGSLPLVPGDIKIKEIDAKNIATDAELKANPRICGAYVVGGTNITTYYYIEIVIPDCLKDIDGGTIRLIMQHETEPNDQIRVIDEHIATEYKNNDYGNRGRNNSLYGWTRQSGGGDFAWMLGDAAAHILFNPWDWAWAVDYKWGDGNAVLGGERIRIYSHPHVTTRVIILD